MTESVGSEVDMEPSNPWPVYEGAPLNFTYSAVWYATNKPFEEPRPNPLPLPFSRPRPLPVCERACEHALASAVKTACCGAALKAQRGCLTRWSLALFPLCALPRLACPALPALPLPCRIKQCKLGRAGWRTDSRG